MKKIEQAEQLTAKKKEFSKWYGQILHVAEILDKRYDAKGMYVWMNYGYEVMMNIKRYWDEIFKAEGLKEMYFPLLVPLSYANINKSWFDGFKAEAFWVKGYNEKEATHILRPTGEPAMYPMFNMWIRSYTDLPLRIYETVSSFRYETRHTRPIIRDREITVWFEIHTAHETEKEAEKEARLHGKLFSMIWSKLAMPYLRVKKPRWECFPGAIGGVEDYIVMPNGKALENGSINLLGQAYAQKFNIKFKDKKGEEKLAWQICTGNGARYLAAVIGIHGDDRGLIIPPEIAPIQVVIIPIYSKKEKKKIEKKTEEIYHELRKEGIRVVIDYKDEHPGSKFYNWELKGVPLRIEIGPKDMAKKSVMIVRRDDNERISIREKEIKKKVKETLEEIQKNLYRKALKEFKTKIVHVNNFKDIVKEVNNGKTISCFWCEDEKCYDKIRGLSEGLDPFGTDPSNKKTGKCICCGKKGKELLYVSNTY